MRGPGLIVALVVPLGLWSCSRANQTNYAHAAIGTGAAIGWVGVHRAITKDCWGRCRLGYLCNEENGLCELGECLPGCEVGTHCVRDLRGRTYCVNDVGGAAARSTLTVAPNSNAGVPIDAGAADAESTDAAAEGSGGSLDAAVNP
jgi:hypothetical protein